MRDCRSFLLPLLLLWVAPFVSAEQPLAGSVVVVYNKAALDSAELARFYAKQRGIATDHIVGLDAKSRKRLLEEYGIEIGAGLGPFKGKAWRIGLMGHSSTRRNVTLVLGAGLLVAFANRPAVPIAP